MGIFSPKTVSVGDLFAGALMPGLLLVALYVAYIVVAAIIQARHSMPAHEARRFEDGSAIVWQVESCALCCRRWP